jgi:hypothetical protein
MMRLAGHVVLAETPNRQKNLAIKYQSKRQLLDLTVDGWALVK